MEGREAEERRGEEDEVEKEMEEELGGNEEGRG